MRWYGIERCRDGSTAAPKRRSARVRRAAARVLAFVLASALPVCAEPQRNSDTDAASASRGPQTPAERTLMTFKATAYALEGKTASGTVAREGIVAADPRVLPLGTRIRVTGAGRYSGEYVVEDTGPKVRGRRIDIRVESTAAAKEFGKQTVQVEVLRSAPARE